jgi:hypothetical protein
VRSYHPLLPVTALVVVFANGCSDQAASVDGGSIADRGTVNVDLGPPRGPYDEVFAQGITRYVDSPVTLETDSVVAWPSSSRPIDVHHFSSDDRGPVCMYGADFFVETRDGPSNNLMIFLQGGGVCLTEICAATPEPILSLQLFAAAGLLGIGGLVDTRNEDNPLREFDVVNAPYCDGSLFSGDVDRVLSDGNADNGEDDMAFQRGLQNLTATLRTAHLRYPNPPRIVLVGSSGGAYGVIAGVVMTRYFYPDIPLLVISDSGAPIVNGHDTGFIRRALTEFQAIDMVPASCTDCLANGHPTGILEWALRRDPDLSVAYMTHARDHVIGEFFMGTTADQFQAAVVSETSRLLREFPGRAFRFVVPGSRHTLAMGMDSLSEGLQGTALGLVGGLNVGFVGPDVNSEELATWAIGGMRETGTDTTGQVWDGYRWVRMLLEDPAHTPDVLQLQ